MSSKSKPWPSFNAANFSKFQSDSTDKRMTKKLSLYISTEDNTPQQVIKKDRSNILLRYLYQQLDKKNVKRRAVQANEASSSSAPICDEEPRTKLPRSSQFQSEATNSATLEQALDNAASEQ